MTASSSYIAHIEHELDGFHQSLAVYRQQVGAWYSQALDKVSDAADLPSLMGMDRIIRTGDSSKSMSMTDDNCFAGGGHRLFELTCAPVSSPSIIRCSGSSPGLRNITLFPTAMTKRGGWLKQPTR